MSINKSLIKKDKSKGVRLQIFRFVYAFIIVVLVFCQLFSFDHFLILIESFWLPGGDLFARFIGGLIVVSEVFALPYLLKMNLSPFLCRISRILSLAVPIIWLALVMWLNSTINAISNVGFFGTVLEFTPGWCALIFSLCLGLLAIFSSWNTSPTRKRL